MRHFIEQYYIKITIYAVFMHCNWSFNLFKIISKASVISILMTCRTPSLSLKKNGYHFFVEIVVQCSKINEKLIFWFLRFLVFELWSIFVIEIYRKVNNFEYDIDHISKTKNQNNWKNDFSFISGHSASLM